MAHHPSGPFRIPAINSIVPEGLKPYIILFFALVFQLSGGVYLATMNEMVGSTALMQEDILMGGYASLAGMSLFFAIMLRVKMRVPSNVAFMVCGTALVICNLICMYTANVFVLVATCFLAGIFRMWATFECNSTIQLWITPVRDMSVFFCYIAMLVQGSILLGGSVDLYVSLFTNWEYVHWLVTGLLLLVMLLTMLLFNSKRIMPPFPLLGIDWLGAFMWGMSLLTVNFICVYGEHYDWWGAAEIQVAIIILLVLLLLNLYRASFIRHPFISLKVFSYRPVLRALVIYVIVDILIAPSHFIEHIFFEDVLGYDTPHLVSMNIIGWLGVAAAAVFTYFYFAKGKHAFKSTFMIGFTAILLHLLWMYFWVDNNTTTSLLALPVFLRNFGYVVIAIVLLSDNVKVPFQQFHFFQALSVQAFMSAASGAAIGGAVLHYVFSLTSAKNFQQITAAVDRVNYQALKTDAVAVQQVIQNQVLLVSFKEVYGYLFIGGIICFIAFLFYRYPSYPKNLIYPGMRAIRRMLKGPTAQG